MNQLERDIKFGESQQPTEAREQQATHHEQISTGKIKQIPFAPQFNWELNQFSEENALKTFSQLANEDINLQKTHYKETSIAAVQATTKGSGLTKNTSFIIRGSDPTHGEIEIIRKYSDIFQLRSALVRRWPGCIIPPIPQIASIGKNEKQINKNKMEMINSFLKRLSKNEPLFASEQLQTFFKSPQNKVKQNLQKLKIAPYDQILAAYREAWPQLFGEMSEEELVKSQNYIKSVEQYFTQHRTDLNYHKDQAKRLGELRTKLNVQRYNMLYKLLPQYEQICLSWFNTKNQKLEEEDKQQGKIYSSTKYQNALEAYKDDLFPAENQSKESWLIYQMLKFEQKQIDSMLQAINEYKYIINEYKYLNRNIENNKKQLEDINNNKLSLKIFLLSGSSDDKKAKLANETEEFEQKLRIVDQFYKGITNLVIRSIQNFYAERCEFYKGKMISSFKKEAIYMAKLFNLYVQTQKI